MANQKSIRGQLGFTLIELMIVVAVISLLSAIAVPSYNNYRKRVFVVKTMTDIKGFEKGFIHASIEYGEFPDDSHIILPPGYGLEEIIPVDTWLRTTPVGGNYNWEGPDNYDYAGIAILGATESAEVMTMLDSRLDDGDLTTGRFRITDNGRHTYILEE